METEEFHAFVSKLVCDFSFTENIDPSIVCLNQILQKTLDIFYPVTTTICLGDAPKKVMANCCD